jgi:isoleucyl-tRNA synthetase
MKKHQFKPVSSQVDFPAMERGLLSWWYESGIVEKYLHRNDTAKENFSFIDGPITANNPMGVHHAWGRTYKDLWQRFNALRGKKERFQNGFDCQGLWVEVEVEKDLGFKSKKDIEAYGIANFVNKCKERVLKYSSIQTEQSKRLGYFMDWDHSYFTMSDENNFMIWHFLKVCFDRGWVYKGHESIPWCPRCETAISQHEMLTEDYKEVTHKAIYFALPIIGRDNEHLLVWTTTPWTLPANIAVAVDEKLDYVLVSGEADRKYWVVKGKESLFGKESKIEKDIKKL